MPWMLSVLAITPPYLKVCRPELAMNSVVGLEDAGGCPRQLQNGYLFNAGPICMSVGQYDLSCFMFQICGVAPVHLWSAPQ